jgi:hypothetical protein
VSRTAALACAVGVLTVAGIHVAIERGRTLRASSELRELPRSARLVLAIETAALRSSASAGLLVGAFVDESSLSDIEATCGLDPLDDLAALLFWVRGSEREPVESFGVQLEGSAARADEIAECHASLVETRGESLVRVEASTGPLIASEDRRSAVALVDDRTVVTGSVQTVVEAMAVRRGLLPALADRAAIADVWPTVRRGAAIAIIVDLPAHWKAALARIAPFDEVSTLLDDVVTLALSAPTGLEPNVVVRVDLRDSDSAEAAAAQIRAWAATPPANVKPPWTTVLESARVRVDGRAVAITLDVSALRRAPARP